MTKKIRLIVGCFDGHGDAVVQYDAHCLVEHAQGCTGSHWMPPLDKCLHRIALEATKVINFE